MRKESGCGEKEGDGRVDGVAERRACVGWAERVMLLTERLWKSSERRWPDGEEP